MRVSVGLEGCGSASIGFGVGREMFNLRSLSPTTIGRWCSLANTRASAMWAAKILVISTSPFSINFPDSVVE